MALPVGRPAASGLYSAQDLAAVPSAAFQLICEVEKWPVWLSFLRSARRIDPRLSLGLGSEVAIRSAIPGEEEELFEVDQFIDGHIVSLVGWYSVRRRIDMRVERKSDRSKVVVRIDYPTYGGVVGAIVDRLTVRRRLETALDDSLIHFKGLVEYDKGPEAVLEDF
ncbi:MAG TPA: hypothetical protein VN905_03140 [Candidatus Binatia bacterium]|nr:hypothetical protein [Candidatus Binatia bacterium]